MKIQEISAKIKERPAKNKPVLIAIDGFGGAGKTTIAQKLKDMLGNAYVIGIDDFIIKERLTEQTAEESYFDRERLTQEVLKSASANMSIQYRKLEWAENKLSAPIAVPEVDYLIVEGISSTHPDVAQYFDVKIWVDTPIEIARERGRARDGSNENAQHWDLWAANDMCATKKNTTPSSRPILPSKMVIEPKISSAVRPSRQN